MLKKLLFALLPALALAAAVALPSAWAADRPLRHLETNPDYVVAWSERSGSAYVRRDSVNMEVYDPPNYEAKASVVYTDRKNRPERTAEEHFIYDYGLRKMYVSKDGAQVYLSPVEEDPALAKLRAVGEMVFTLANNRHFYGKDGGYTDEFYINAQPPRGHRRHKAK